MGRIEEVFQKILEIVTGSVEAKHPYEWVENAFSSETKFSEAYEDFSLAREHLCERFCLEEDDDDLELFMNGLLKLEEDLGRRMFLNGIRYACMERED